jgi:hypothetical protein
VEIYFEPASWRWGLLLIVVTVAIQATGVVLMALWGADFRSRLEARGLGLWSLVPTLIGVIASTGLLLTALHGLEAALWAAAYVWLGAFDTPVEAMRYSLDSLTTRGASQLVPHGQWNLLGAIEAANGMLLFGMSTAFIFGIMQAYWPMLHRDARPVRHRRT